MLSTQGVSLQTIEVDDFSGGMTDNILGAPQNKFQLADNYYLFKVGNKARLLTRPAVRAYTSARVPTNSRINDIFDIEEKLFQISSRRIYENTTSTFTEVTGVGGNVAFNNGDASSKYSVSVWQKHAIIANDAFSYVCKLFNNGTAWTVHNLGLPKPTGTVTLTSSAAGTGYSYSYAFHYFYSYNNQGVTFEEESSIVFKAVTSTTQVGTSTITITPPAGWTITNGGTTNYDTANLKIKIYRTQNNGSTYFYLTTVNHNFTTYVDNTTDGTLTAPGSLVLYTNGADDIPMHAQPPQSKYAHIVNDILCLGYVQENGQYIPNKARFSNRFSPWSCPEEFYEEFDEEIVGISSFNIYPIYFCKNKVYRIEGYYLPDGSGGVLKKQISSTAGCMSHNSIVKTDIGLFWCGNDGWYFTDGYNVTRISDDLLSSYLRLITTTTQRSRIYGTYYPKLQIVLWAMQELDSRNDNDKIFVVHLQAGISSNMPFTTWSGGYTDRNAFLPSSLHHVAGKLYQADYNGYLMYYDHDIYSDHKIDTSLAVASWLKRTIIYDYMSVSYDFGSSSAKKWVPKMFLNAENASSLSMQIYSNNDNSGSFRPLKEVAPRGLIAFGTFGILFGDPTIRFNYFPIITAKRGFPANGLRCFYKQIRFTNAYTNIATSSQLGSGLVNGVANTITISGALDFPEDCLDYYIHLSNDAYSNAYRITNRTAKTLTLEDAFNVLPTGTFDWQIKGYRRDEIVRVISYTINYGFTQQSAEPYRGDE